MKLCAVVIVLLGVSVVAVRFPTRTRLHPRDIRHRQRRWPMERAHPDMGHPSQMRYPPQLPQWGGNQPQILPPNPDISQNIQPPHESVLPSRDNSQRIVTRDTVLFPDSSNIREPIVNVPPNPSSRPYSNIEEVDSRLSNANCSEADFKVIYPPGGACESLLEKGPCAQNQWLVLKKSDDQPHCEAQPCIKGFSNGNRTCTTQIRCHYDKEPYVSPYGDVTCLCSAGTVLWKDNGNCYRPYTRGPCPPDSQLVLDALDQPVCMQNLCDQENKVLMKSPNNQIDTFIMDRKAWDCFSCHELRTQGPCPKGEILDVKLETLRPACVSADFALDIRQLLRTAAFRCSSGFYRSASGVCRRGVVVKNYRNLFFG